MPATIGLNSVIVLCFVAACLMLPSMFTDYTTNALKVNIFGFELRLTQRLRMVGSPDAVIEICANSTCSVLSTPTTSSSSSSSSSSSTSSSSSSSSSSSCSSIDTRRIVSLSLVSVGCFFGFCASVMLCCYVNTTPPPPPYPMMQFQQSPQLQPPPPSAGGGRLHTCIMISLILQFCLCATAFGLFTHTTVQLYIDCSSSGVTGMTSTVTPGVGLYLLGIGVFLSLLCIVIKLFVGYGIEPLGQPGPYDVPMMTMSHPGGAGGYPSFPSNNNNYGYRGGQGNMLITQPSPSYQQQLYFDTIQVMTSPSHSVYSPGGHSNNNYVSPTNQYPMYQQSQVLKNNGSSGYYAQ
eukprot:PhF_6_TR14972/c0_g1_i6/m.23521